jgi:hypothetical protein
LSRSVADFGDVRSRTSRPRAASPQSAYIKQVSGAVCPLSAVVAKNRQTTFSLSQLAVVVLADGPWDDEDN